MDVEMIRAHRAHMELLRNCMPEDRFAYAMYQAWCIGADERVEPWDALTAEVRAGWRASADFAQMYMHTLEIDAIVRAM